jgi:hypothetical protein
LLIGPIGASDGNYPNIETQGAESHNLSQNESVIDGRVTTDQVCNPDGLNQ